MSDKSPRPKRPDGSGTVYKLSGRRTRPWVARKTIGNVDGKPLYKIVGYYATKTEGQKALLKDEMFPIHLGENTTVKQLYDDWSASHFEHISPDMASNYKTAYNYLKKYESKPFAELKKAHFQAIIDANMDKSRSLLVKIRGLFNQLSKYAYDNDIIHKNYAVNLKVPPEVITPKTTFSEEEIKTLFANDTIPFVDTVIILIFTGMRIGELLTAETQNVNLESRYLVGGSKTRAGRYRVIPIHADILKYIRARYDPESKYLIANNGEPITTAEYRNDIFKPLMLQLGFNPDFTPHITRHTFTTLLSQYCKDDDIKKKILGHTDWQFSVDRYVHPEHERYQSAIDSIKL